MSEIIVTPMSKQEAIKKYNIDSWGTWSSPVKTFDWSYPESETCYIFEGKAIIHADNIDVEINAGDLVVFPSGLNCVWEVIIPINKAYNFI
jgi:Predicted enzyme of the cupin superfamily